MFEGLNAALLNGLAVKSNYADLLAATEQASAQNKAKEMAYAQQLNALRQQDEANALNAYGGMLNAQSQAAKQPVLKRDVADFQDYEKKKRAEILDPVIKKYNGDLIGMLQTMEGRKAALDYRNAIETNPEIPNYLRRAAIVSANQKAAQTGAEPIDYYSPDTKQWYTPEQQVQAFESGELPDLSLHQFERSTGKFDAGKYYSQIEPPTDKEIDYYKLDGRLPVDSDEYAKVFMEHTYPSIPADPNNPVYQRYFDRAKKAYEAGDTKYYYKNMAPEQLRMMQQRFGIQKTQAQIDAANRKAAAAAAPVELEVQPYSVLTTLHDPKAEEKYDTHLNGYSISLPPRKTPEKITASAFYIPSTVDNVKASAGTLNSSIHTRGAATRFSTVPVTIPAGATVVSLPVDSNGIPNVKGSRHSLFMLGYDGNGYVGYAPIADANSILQKSKVSATDLSNRFLQYEAEQKQQMQQQPAQQPAAPVQQAAPAQPAKPASRLVHSSQTVDVTGI